MCQVTESSAIMIDVFYGYMKLVHVRERHGSRIWLGGYSITFDREGNEISRTPVTWNGMVDCGSIGLAMSYL
jgi:hypothetical protein